MAEPVVRVERVGLEGRPIVVVDGFAPEPDRLVAQTAGREFRRLGAYYPGGRAPAPADYFEGLGGLLATIAREVFGAGERLSVDRALYSVSHAPPETLSLAQRIPHIDTVATEGLAIVHYLFDGPFGGTGFFRHRSTGFETITAERHRPYLDRLRDEFAEQGEPPAAYIGGDTTLFERTSLQAPAFNRAILYPANLLHCAALPNDRRLSSDPQSGRLTIASFLTAR